MTHIHAMFEELHIPMMKAQPNAPPAFDTFWLANSGVSECFYVSATHELCDCAPQPSQKDYRKMRNSLGLFRSKQGPEVRPT